MNETKELLKDIVFGIQKLFPLLKRGDDRHGELIEKINGLGKSCENLEVVNTLKEVKQSIEKIDLKVPKLQRVKVINQVEMPEEVKVKKPEWLPNIKSVASDLIAYFEVALRRVFTVRLEQNSKRPGEYVSVRLTNGKEFYEGGGGGIVGYGSPDYQKVKIYDPSELYGVGVAPRTQTPTGNALQVQIGPGDVISNIPVVMDYDHHQLHEGETFRWSSHTASLALNANKDIRLVVPNITIPSGVNAVSLCPHFRFEVVASDLAQVFLYEATTFNANGSQRTPIALERNGSYTPKLQIWEGPTVNVVGNLIWQGLLLGTKTTIGDLVGSENEFVLKNNTSYNLRVTSGANGNKVLIRMVWYEDLGV